MSSDDVITFGSEMSSSEVDDYRRKIASAKGAASVKGKEPLGGGVRKAPVSRPTSPQGVRPRPSGSPVLSAHTQSQLEALGEAQDEEVEEATVEDPMELEQEDQDILEMLNYSQMGEAERLLNNKKRRQAIESRCEPLSLRDLIMKDEVSQVVPIVPGEFEVTYRSLLPEESLFLKEFMLEDQDKPQSYFMEKLGLCQLAFSVVNINGEGLGEVRNSKREIDRKLFEKKLSKITKKSAYVIADLGVNYHWFDLRVRSLLNPDLVGNG